MTVRHRTPRPATALVLLLVAAFAFAQPPQPECKYQPEVGQEGKDVVWVPTPQELVEKMLDMAEVGPKDFVVDLGSGDGRTVIAAAKRGARALGIEYNPSMVELARCNAARAGVAGRAQFLRGDIFQTDFSHATVVTLFLLTDLNLRLRPTLLAMKPGTRVVSNTFRMGDWEPDETAELQCGTYCTAYLWIVPAKVNGLWHSEPGDLKIEQHYQFFSGTLANGARVAKIADGRLRGEEIRFSVNGAEYRGRVTGNAIEGTVNANGKISPWRAWR